MANQSKISFSPHAFLQSFELIGLTLWSPDELFLSVKPPESEQGSKKFTLNPNAYRVYWLLLSIGFAFYMLYFAYPTMIFWTCPANTLYPYEVYLNVLINILVCLVFLEIWKIVDNAILKLILKYPKDQHALFSKLIRLSYAPLLPLFGLFGILRLMFMDDYLRWGLAIIPIFTVLIAFGWHYFLLWYFAQMYFASAPDQTRIKWGICIALCCCIVLTFIFFLEVPSLFHTNAQDFIENIF